MMYSQRIDKEKNNLFGEGLAKELKRRFEKNWH